jgi:hypothetical protein
VLFFNLKPEPTSRLFFPTLLFEMRAQKIRPASDPSSGAEKLEGAIRKIVWIFEKM